MKHLSNYLLTMAVGISTLLDALGNIFDVPALSEVGMSLYLVLGIVWPVVIGIQLIKNAGPAGRSAHPCCFASNAR